MTPTTLKLTSKQAAPIVKAAFPKYKGRKFNLLFTDTVLFHDTNWSDGTRNFYASVRTDGTVGRFASYSPWNNPVEGQTVQLPADVIVVQHTYYCGVDCGITIYAHPSLAPALLPAAK